MFQKNNSALSVEKIMEGVGDKQISRVSDAKVQARCKDFKFEIFQEEKIKMATFRLSLTEH